MKNEECNCPNIKNGDVIRVNKAGKCLGCGRQTPFNMPVTVVVCPIYDDTHYCKNKIGEGCNCKCICMQGSETICVNCGFSGEIEGDGKCWSSICKGNYINILPDTPPETSSWEEEFDNKFKYVFSEKDPTYGAENQQNKINIKAFIYRIATSEYKRGRQSIIDEWNHERQKLLEGFSHAKDCEMCKFINNL